jgi:hypothetical protein
LATDGLAALCAVGPDRPTSGPRPLAQPKALQVIKSSSPKTPPPSNKLVFGQTFTDHMLTIPWNSQKGWGAPVIRPCASCSRSLLPSTEAPRRARAGRLIILDPLQTVPWRSTLRRRSCTTPSPCP